MKLETFFEKFDQFAAAPDAVEKMRELVLQLAVQGKLVDQKHSDGTAAQLLATISNERDTRAAKLRTPDEPASADGSEHAFPIPSNWEWTQLGKVALQIQYGYTASADPSATEIRMLRITDIQNNRVDWQSVPGCQIESDEAEKYLLSLNDILIARTGGTIGKSFIMPDAPVKSVFASYLIRVTPPHSMAARYLKTFLESPLYWSQLRQMSAGTGQPNVNGQALGRLEIPIPPLAEQQRIVAKVDELMGLCNRLETQQQERETRHSALARASLARFADAPTPANLNLLFHDSYTVTPSDIRKSILTLAVQGKLVPQDPNEELSDSIPEIIPSSPPLDVPDSWRWTEFAEIGEISGGFAFKSGDYTPSGVFILRVTNIAPNGVIGKDEAVFLPPEKVTKEVERFYLNEGDILLVMVGGSLGKIGLVTSDILPALLNQNLWRITPVNGEVDSQFLRLITEFAVSFQRQITHSTHGHLSREEFRKKPVAFPPLAEQRRIVAKVDQLMALVDQLEAQLTASRATAEKLMEAVVAELTT